MKQLQFYKYATIILMLFNLSMIAFLLLHHPPHPHQHGGRHGKGGAVALLQLNEEQHTFFRQSAAAHHEQMISIARKQQDLLMPYFQTLLDSTKQMDKNALLNEVQHLERNKIEITYQHFQEIKSTLEPEQQTKFEVFINHILNKVLFKSRPGPPPSQ